MGGGDTGWEGEGWTREEEGWRDFGTGSCLRVGYWGGVWLGFESIGEEVDRIGEEFESIEKNVD